MLMDERSEPQHIDRLLIEGEFLELEKEFLLIDEKWIQQSYFVIQDTEDRRIWDWFGDLMNIEDPLAKRREFLRRRVESFD
ncbi:MAG: hypothetical protein FVQ80_12960 [Planctomycetes bacterium]|nr:hypothetical protein [Planctomycetota bacterium]